jgi:hypothetical protein
MLYLTTVFKTVPSLPVGDNIQQQLHQILNILCKCYLDVDLDQCHFPIFDNVTNNCSTNLPLSLDIGTLPKGYVRNVPLPRVPVHQSAPAHQVQAIPDYYEDPYRVPTYGIPRSIVERAAYAFSPARHAVAINT